MSQSRSPAPLSGWIAGILPALFWGSLGLCTLLAAILVLSPRWLHMERLRIKYVHNAQQISELRRETDHLARVAEGLKTDADFLARVASTELHLLPAGSVKIPLASSLDYDSRSLTPAERSVPTPVPPPVFLPLLELIAESRSIRLRLASVAMLLLILAFFCCNESFFQSILRGLGRGCSRRLGRRYTARAKRVSADL